MSRNGTFITKGERAEIVATLQEVQRRCGSVSNDIISLVATSNGVSERSVRRWIQGEVGPAQPRPVAFQLTESHLTVVAANPSMKAAWSALRAQDPTVPSYPHFTKLMKQVQPSLLAGIRQGRAAMHSRQLFVPQEPRLRNQEWQIDHLYLPLRVKFPTLGKPVSPILTTIIDAASRMVIATAIWPKAPTGLQVLAVVAKAVQGFDCDGTFVGGVPDALRSDRGAELIGTEMTQGMIRLGIVADPTRARGAWEKGIVERWQGVLKTEWCAHLPGYTDGPENYAGGSVLQVTEAELLPIADVRDSLAAWVHEYNTRRIHLSINVTPIQAWRADTTPITRGRDSAIASCALKVDRTWAKTGVMHDNTRYLSSALKDVSGKVRVAVLPDFHAHVWVQVKDQWHRAVPSDALPEGDYHEIMNDRATVERTVTKIHKGARRHRSSTAAANALQAGHDVADNTEEASAPVLAPAPARLDAEALLKLALDGRDAS